MLTTQKCHTRIRLKLPSFSILVDDIQEHTQGTYRKDKLLPWNVFGLFRDKGAESFDNKVSTNILDKFSEVLRGVPADNYIFQVRG